MKVTAQTTIFIGGVSAGALQAYEEILHLVPLLGITAGQDTDAMPQCVKQHSLNLSHLECVTTDSALALTGEKKGTASLLEHHCAAAGHTQPIQKVHGIIH